MFSKLAILYLLASLVAVIAAQELQQRQSMLDLTICSNSDPPNYKLTAFSVLSPLLQRLSLQALVRLLLVPVRGVSKISRSSLNIF